MDKTGRHETWCLLSVLAALLVLCATSACGTRKASLMPHGEARQAPLATAVNSPEDRKIVRNADLHLLTPAAVDFPVLIESARNLCLEAGGYVSEESSASITLRIPNRGFDSASARLSTLGTVSRKNVTARDVTDGYTDLEIRLDHARKLAERLKGILQQAGTVAEILEVERELSRVTLEIEQLEGQKRLMDNQTTFASLKLTLGVQFVQTSAHPRKGPLGWAFYELYRGVRWLFVRG